MKSSTKIWLIVFGVVAVLLVACIGVFVAAIPVARTLSSNYRNVLSQANSAAVEVINPKPVSSAASPQVQVGDIAAFESTLEQIYANVNPSVVNINVVIGSGSGSNSQNFQHPTVPGVPNFQIPNGPQEALGSGFVWDTQGHIVTNNHVVSGASQIVVTFWDGTVAEAKLVGAAPNADLAVIKVDVAADKLHPVTLADSSQVKVGQMAVAIGNPYGLSGTMTSGIVSALSRSLPVDSSSQLSSSGARYSIPDIIQTDASINPGNSGGVLVNAEGKLIGVTAAIESSTNSNSGIGFVIPSAIVQKVVPSIVETGKFDQPWLGIEGQTLTPETAKTMGLDVTQQGVLVIAASQGGPAAKAGLQGATNQDGTGGDIIVAIDNQPVKRFEDLSSYLINKTKAGQSVTLTLLRNGKQQTVQVTLGVLPQQ